MLISQLMTYALAAALLAMSARAALAPRGAAVAYGVPLLAGMSPTPYLEVKANRDFSLAALLVVLAFANHTLLAYGLFFGAVAPAADAWIVGHHGKLAGISIHVATVAFMIVAGAAAATGH